MSEGAAQTSALPPIELLVHGLPPTGAQWLQGYV
ncbi:unnamed protein product [Gongylonema pulchrum]|uniref:Alpha/beta hydrolase n=1 Tax=Gongylonema pulchrum TaxID=637853 RepID=A0A183EB94_9BILA|nr:unnamed protein product [Gongylonema pulchrum]